MREEREATITEAANFLDRAERLATSDPAAALPLLRSAVEAARRVDVQCLETRALASLGLTLALLGKNEEAKVAFRSAYRFFCRCCRPIVDRCYAYFLDMQGLDLKPEALEFAARAVAASHGPRKGLAFTALGTVRYHAGDYSGAVEAHSEALDMVPVSSPHHPMILANLADALRRSGKLEDARRAERILRGLPLRFQGLKYLTVERNKVDWALAATLALIARIDPDLKPYERRQLLREARKILKPAVGWLGKKRLALDAAAAQVDLAAIQVQLDPLEVLDTLEEVPVAGKQHGKAFDLTEVLEDAKDAAGAIFNLENKRRLMETLKAVRAATVAAGADPPVMSYAAP